MTTLTDPPAESFKLSMLIYDTRYRSITFQVIALIAFLTLIGWLVNNTAQNLADLGKEPSFGFMGEAAGYDINQRFIEYSSQSTHLRAAFVGLLNTLFVAVMGCITATIIGVIVGVARLSKNWMIARLMTIYVEMFRNVPVLMWIVLCMAILIETLPKPSSFKGENAESSMSFFNSVAFTNQGISIPRFMTTNLSWVLVVVFLASIAATVYVRRRAARIHAVTGVRPNTALLNWGIAIVPVALAFVALSPITKSAEWTFISSDPDAASSLSETHKSVRRFDLCYASGKAQSLGARTLLEADGIGFRRKEYFNFSEATDNFINGNCDLLPVASSEATDHAVKLTLVMAESGETPKLTVMSDNFSLGPVVSIEYPELTKKGIPRFEGGSLIRNSLIALWLALSLYTAAFVAEIVRAGILAISKGQTEAAAALGVRPRRIMSLVVLPQAMRIIVPPLISQYLNLTKNSSLAIAVGYMDITGTLMGITLNQTGKELETVLLGMVVYLIISLSISAVMNWYNTRVKLVER